MDEEAVVHSSPVAEVVSVHSAASPDLSERAFSEPPERPEREGRLRVRPRILKPPSDLPPGELGTQTKCRRRLHQSQGSRPRPIRTPAGCVAGPGPSLRRQAAVTRLGIEGGF